MVFELELPKRTSRTHLYRKFAISELELPNRILCTALVLKRWDLRA